MNENSHHTAVLTYLDEIKELYYSGQATEHSYRRPIENLIESLLPDIDAINEPKRVDVGAPDFVLMRRRNDHEQLELIKSVPLGFIEAKDIKPAILDRPENKAQVERYMDLGNVIHTDGLTFRFYFERKLIKEVSLGHLNDNGHIVVIQADPVELQYWLQKTVETATPTIRTAKMLALYMADRARPIRATIQNALEQDLDSNQNTDLATQYFAFKETLIHDMSVQDFADIYAETIAYGLFAARYNDDSLSDFTLSEAAQKIPQTNPFLRQFFLQIAAYEKDIRLDWVLNNFADLFSHADVHKIMSTYGKNTGMNHDPVTHFYETFLGEYDSMRRKARGVYYTPRPVVRYIVRAVDRVLKEEFGLSEGIADDSTITRTFNVAPYKKGAGKGSKTYHTVEREIPRVQILDPATGTSTFLNETIKLIANKKAERLGSAWSDYVEKSLLPRIHGFEILMAAYSMAHMRLGLTLTETGYKPSANPPRLGVYLTNALEEPAESEPPLLSMLGMGRVLTEEAIQADKVKRDLPIMVVMGNPPYSVSSTNKSKHIDLLMSEYKRDLNERNIQPLSDDYIKFIRYAEHMIEKNGQGVVAMITNNSYIDGLIHRQMRKHLLQTFDKIWVLDLHGNAKKKEVAPDGGKDENVFDIMQGVSIVLLMKTGEKKVDEHGEVQFGELFGKRTDKYSALESFVATTLLPVGAPNYFFVKKDISLQGEYDEFISVRELMPFGDAGVKTHRDRFAVSDTKAQLLSRLERLREGDPKIIEEFGLKNTRDFNIEVAQKTLKNKDLNSLVSTINYRPFDSRFFVNIDTISDWPRHRTMDQLHSYKNIGLSLCRQQSSFDFQHVLMTDNAIDMCFISSQTKETGYVFPLYVHQGETRTANLDTSLLKILFKNMPFTLEELDDGKKAASSPDSVSPENILDYIYAVLYNPSYREKYKEFLKIDFPRVPAPRDAIEFWNYVKIGKQLRELHLMKNVSPEEYHLKGDGDGVVDKISFVANATGSVDSTTGSVYINETQYFENVPETAWSFYIGGYQPAQKWLKDRKGRPLNYQDVEHYQRIIKILFETDRIMKEIDD